MTSLHHLLAPKKLILIRTRRSPKEKLRCLHLRRTKQSKHRHLRWKWSLWGRWDFHKLHLHGSCMKREFLSKKILGDWYLKNEVNSGFFFIIYCPRRDFYTVDKGSRHKLYRTTRSNQFGFKKSKSYNLRIVGETRSKDPKWPKIQKAQN